MALLRGSANSHLPRLGIVYHPQTVEVFVLVRASQHTWRNVWLVDRDRLIDPTDLRIFHRFGEMIDITGGDLEQIAAQTSEPIQAVLISNDADLLLGAELAEAFHARFCSPAAAIRLNDKPAQRAAFRAAGLPSPECIALRAGNSIEDALLAAAEMTYPAVLKPAKGAGSRATGEVRSPAELAARLAEHGTVLREDLALEARIPDGWLPPERPWADHLSVESFCSAGRFHHFGLTGRFPLLPEFRETGNIVPADVPHADWPQLFELAETAIRSLEVGDGYFHTELKFSPDGPRVLEVNGRLGGGSIPWGAERVTGHSLIALAGRAALGLPIDLGEVNFAGVAFGYYLQPPLGATKLISWAGIEEARALPGVEELIIFRESGDPVDGAKGFYGHVGAIRGRVDTHADLAALYLQINSTLKAGY